MKTVEAFRIYKSRYASSAMTGEGAKKFGGRWNDQGGEVVYCSSSLALAQFKTLVHLQGPLPLRGFEFVRIEFPQNLIKHRIEVSDLEKFSFNWRDYPSHVQLREIGDQWISSRKSLVLQVPSAVSSTESNYLLNPLHRDFS